MILHGFAIGDDRVQWMCISMLCITERNNTEGSSSFLPSPELHNPVETYTSALFLD